jgi:hypothetical protein
MRIPKLAVRNRVPEDDIDIISKDAGRRPPLSSQSSDSTISPTLVRMGSDRPFDSQEQANGSSSAGGKAGSNASVKKTGSGVIGFLTLKEPSSLALEDFAEAQKKAAAQKGGTVSASSRKLPEYVPKTNSRWDGLTERARRKSVDSKKSTVSKASRRASAATSRSTQSGSSTSSGGQDSTQSAKPSSSRSCRPKTLARSIDGDSASSSTSTALSPGHSVIDFQPKKPTAIHPALRDNVVAPWEEPREDMEPPSPRTRRLAQVAVQAPSISPETLLQPPSPAPILPKPDLLGPTEPELSEITRLEDCELSSNAATSPEESPPIPVAHEAQQIPSVAEDFQYVQFGQQRSHADPAGTFWNDDTDTEDAALALSRPPKPKPTTNFSRPMPSPSPTLEADFPLEPIFDDFPEDEDDLPQATLRDISHRTSSFVLDESPIHSRKPSVVSYSPVSTLPSACSTSSRMTNVTAATSTTATQSLKPPTFAEVGSEADRPISATSSFKSARSVQQPWLSLERMTSNTSSMAQSEMSEQWTLTSKQRLGLGGKVTKRDQSDLPPWEVDETAQRSGTQKHVSGRRASGVSETSKLRRLSIKLGHRK